MDAEHIIDVLVKATKLTSGVSADFASSNSIASTYTIRMKRFFRAQSTQDFDDEESEKDRPSIDRVLDDAKTSAEELYTAMVKASNNPNADYITLNEFKIFMPNDKLARQARRLFDLNGDGTVAQREIERVLAHLKHEKKSLAYCLQDTKVRLSVLCMCAALVLLNILVEIECVFAGRALNVRMMNDECCFFSPLSLSLSVVCLCGSHDSEL